MSKYTEAEIGFLTASHRITEARGNKTKEIGSYPALQDLRSLGAPEALFEMILNQRAKQLGKRFIEYRASGKGTGPVAKTAVETATVTALESEVSNSKLF